MGKTILIKRLAWFFARRKSFRDFIFIINLNNINKGNFYENHLKKLILKQIGSNEEEDFEDFFRDKQMLLVFEEMHKLE